MTKIAGGHDPFAFALAATRIGAPIGPISVVAGDSINRAIADELGRKPTQKRPWIRRFEDFLGHYMAAGFCLAR